jgi:hypothetical protein
MQYPIQLQFDYSTDSILYFGSEESLTIFEFICDHAEKYHGLIFQEYYDKGTTLVLKFPELINAQCFFNDFKQKMIPRMFIQDNNGKSHFEPFKDDDVWKAVHSDFYE